MKRRSRGTKEQGSIIHEPAVDAGRVWYAVGNRHEDRKSFDRDDGVVPVGIDTVAFDGGM